MGGPPGVRLPPENTMFRSNSLQRAADRQARHHAETSRHAAERAWNGSQSFMDRLADLFGEARDRSAPWADRTASQASHMADESLHALRSGSRAVRDRALVASALTAGYVRRHPARSTTLLLAGAATVWALMAMQKKRRRSQLERRADELRSQAQPTASLPRPGDNRGSDLPGASQAMDPQTLSTTS